MNERDIFLAAIEIADPAQRAAYVEQACISDAELRAQVKELLKTHEQASQFLETPAVASDSVPEQTILTASSDSVEDFGTSGEAEFRNYLKPTTRPGWLGRLAHYEVEQILGRGAFGIVAKAFDEKLHRVVAIKLMSPELASTSPPRKRFLREARTAAAVTHENIVAIYAVEEEPIPYLVMEYIPGLTLQQRMDEQGPLELPEILWIGQQIASGLAAAHAANLIHRDIKPSNILLSDSLNERAKISDFGLARAVDDASMTRSGLIAGTPMYMAPEQARGEVLDHRADLFSLGSVLYQMAGGHPPFRAANTVAVLKRVCEDTPRPLGDVLPGTPGWLETIIFKLLEKERDDRYQTAQEVADLLSRCMRELEHSGKVNCIEDRSCTAKIFQPTKSTGTGARNKPLGWLVGGVMAVAAVIGIVLMNGGKETPDPELTRLSGDGTSASTTGKPAKPAAITTWHGWPDDAPPPAIAPFDADQAKQHQQTWADHLGVSVEKEIVLGQDDDGNDLILTMVLIPPGEFKMGSTDTERNKFLKQSEAEHDEFAVSTIPYEGPQYRARITSPFWLSRHELTRGQFRRFVEETGYKTDAERDGKGGSGILDGQWVQDPRFVWNADPDVLRTDDHPVTHVSWNDATAFNEWLSEKHTDTRFVLPSEAQWEYACRAGTTTRFWSGDEDNDLIQAGWFGGNSGGRTHAAGELKANPFGLSDVHGNVWEWCVDWHSAYDDTQSVVNDPIGLQGSRRVFRSGDFSRPARWSRSACRGNSAPDYRSIKIGFRPAALFPEHMLQDKTSTFAASKPKAHQEGGVTDALSPSVGRFSLVFDGQKSMVKIPTLIIDDDHALTVEVWAVLEPQVDQYKSKDLVSNASYAGFSLGIPPAWKGNDSQKWAFSMRSNSINRYVEAWEKKPVPQGRPIHVAGVFDGKAEIRFYVDGQLQSRSSATEVQPSTMYLTLGNNHSQESGFRGRMNEVRISRVARYDKDFEPNKRFNPDEDTIALYHFDEGNGDVLKDSSGNGHHGEIASALWVKRKD